MMIARLHTVSESQEKPEQKYQSNLEHTEF